MANYSKKSSRKPVCKGGEKMDLEKVATEKKGRGEMGGAYGQRLKLKDRYK